MDTSEQEPFADALVAFVRDEVALGDESVDLETDLVMSGLVDSLGIVAVVEWIEKRLGVEIDPGDVVIEHFESVGAMVEYLRSRGDCTVD